MVAKIVSAFFNVGLALAKATFFGACGAVTGFAGAFASSIKDDYESAPQARKNPSPRKR